MGIEDIFTSEYGHVRCLSKALEKLFKMLFTGLKLNISLRRYIDLQVGQTV